MSEAAELRALRSVGGTVFLGIGVGLVAGAVWMLIFTEFAIVPADTPYPEAWTSLTSGAQVAWLREHTVVLSGFAAVEYIGTHFAQYAKHVSMIFGLSVFAALCASLATWHVHRDA
jgi:hypothetical protein